MISWLFFDALKEDFRNETIMLPEYVPKEYADRETLWNEVEKIEKGKKAQLAYSFDFALQNEFTMEENIELAKKS